MAVCGLDYSDNMRLEEGEIEERTGEVSKEHQMERQKAFDFIDECRYGVGVVSSVLQKEIDEPAAGVVANRVVVGGMLKRKVRGGAKHKGGKQRIMNGTSYDTESNGISNGAISTSTSGDDHHQVSSTTAVSDHALVVSDGYELSRRARKNRHNRRNYRMDHK